MSDREPPQRLAPGSLIVVQDADGHVVELVVEDVEEGSIRVAAEMEGVRPGDLVEVEHCVPGDARYRTRAQVAREDDRLRLHPTAGWERDNQRAYVRVRTYGLEVTLSQPLADLEEAADPEKRYPMLDVSAGGTAIRAEPCFEAGDELVCHFELPGECCFALPARVVGVRGAGSERLTATVGLEFLGIGEGHRAALLRWIFREQARRRRPAR